MAEVGGAIVVAGNYRCGTTWLAETIASALGREIVFEPIRSYYPSVRAAGIERWRPYITRESATPEQTAIVRDMLSGRICSYERLFRTNAEAVLVSPALVTKFVRGLCSLRWIVDTFEPQRTFVIARNPADAVSSQLRVGAAVGTPTDPVELEAFFARHPEVEPFEPRDVVEWLATYWAISYHAAFSTSRPHPWTFLRYEDLVGNSAAVLGRVIQPLMAGVTPIAPDRLRELVERPSSQTKRDEGIRSRRWSPLDYDRSAVRSVWGVVERFDTVRRLYEPS